MNNPDDLDFDNLRADLERIGADNAALQERIEKLKAGVDKAMAIVR